MSTISELIINASPALENLNIEYNPNPPEIQTSINALRLIIQKIFSGDLDHYNGPEITDLKSKLIEAIPTSNRVAILRTREMNFLGSQYISACTCSEKVKFGPRKSFTAWVIREARALFKDQKKFLIGSLGSGWCHQELMVHSAFLRKECAVNWVLVDRELSNNNSTVYKASEQFKKITHFLGGECNVELRGESLFDYCNSFSNATPETIPHILIVADLEYQGSSVNLTRVHEKLAELKNPETPRLFMQLDKHTGISCRKY